MSWEEIDKLLVKMFDSQLKKLKSRQISIESTSQKKEIPSLEFKGAGSNGQPESRERDVRAVGLLY